MTRRCLTPLSLAIVALALAQSRPARPCTNFLITPGASADGSSMITYAADSHELYGALSHRPAGIYEPGTKLDIYEWDTGKYLGQIDQAEETYEVIGNMNEHQVSIGETTYGGREELVNPKGIMDYGSLIYVTLQRAHTAREAIGIMASLVADYGYCSEGESFSIADPKEVWFMDMIGKGPGEKGAVWVARKLPDGTISAHANQARIRTFPLKDKRNCLYAPDVISFARKKGYFKGRDRDFSFVDAYAPMTFVGRRICEARVYAMFHRAAPSKKLSLDYARGVPDAEPLPLWIEPDRKLAVNDVMALMRDHFEGTPFDLNEGVGAGPFGLPYRWRPLFWKLDGKEYFNERATSTQQTGFSFVAQLRSWLPDPIGGVFWFGVDDTFSTVYVPIYGGVREIPKAFAEQTADFEHFSWESAFWVFNVVSNWAYTRYRDMIKDIQVVQRNLEGLFLARQPSVEKAALRLYKQAPELCRDYLTKYSRDMTALTMSRWHALAAQLFMRYMDGNVRDEKGKVTHPPYPDQWYRRIVNEKGDFYLIKKLPGEPEPKKSEKPACAPCEGG